VDDTVTALKRYCILNAILQKSHVNIGGRILHDVQNSNMMLQNFNMVFQNFNMAFQTSKHGYFD